MRIWVNGCFDILHDGHLDLLEFASKLGDVYVGIDSNERVKQLKGDDRPINDESFRLRLLQSLRSVKDVFIFDNDEELISCIKMINPDYMVIGEDYKGKRVIGGEDRTIIYFPHTKGKSTTNTIDKIRK
jgi:D-beta-D-heptose 7-phosphate kinase/D-beta-D-heptose 1-phosphate adenosyltransferase